MVYKVLSVFGTRPEAIKMAPLVKKLADDPRFDSQVLVTAQHREMLDQVLKYFAIKPDYDLNIMRPGQTLTAITSYALTGIGNILMEARPDIVLVHGDTTSTFAGALSAYYNKIKIGHVEAGLRTGCKYAPFPEEMNRNLAGVLADVHFAPTKMAVENLLKENVPADRIFQTGNTVVDALLQVVEGPDPNWENIGLDTIDWRKKVILLTCHRRENWGEPMENIFSGIAELCKKYPDIEVIFPVHKNPIVRGLAGKHLSSLPQVHLTEPLDYLPLCHVLDKCYLVMTDSGGLQEEAPALGKPVLVLRDVTERPEGLEAGTACLVGSDRERIVETAGKLLTDRTLYHRMAKAINPYGDGLASGRIADMLAAFLQKEESK